MDDSVVILENSLEIVDLTTESESESPTIVEMGSNVKYARGASRKKPTTEELNKHRRLSIADIANNRKMSFSNSSLCRDIEEALTRFACPICLDIFPVNEVSATRCGHVYCTECITMVLKGNAKCPTCNKIAEPSSLIKLYI